MSTLVDRIDSLNGWKLGQTVALKTGQTARIRMLGINDRGIASAVLSNGLVLALRDLYEPYYVVHRGAYQ